MAIPTLRTGRLKLRAFEERDAPALLQLLGDDRVTAYLPMFSLKNEPEALSYFQAKQARYDRTRGYWYAICLKDADSPIGQLTIKVADSRDMGYALLPRYWGQGMAAEAAAAGLQQAAADGLDFVTATHDIKNPASGRVMGKLGLTYRYSYEEMWQPKNYPVTFRLYQKNYTKPPDFTYMGFWDKYPKHLVEEDL